MSKLLFMDGFAMLKLWVVGFFGFHFTGIIHVLPAIAAFAFLLSFLRYKLSIQNKLIKRKLWLQEEKHKLFIM
jgi:hypothetical protein